MRADVLDSYQSAAVTKGVKEKRNAHQDYNLDRFSFLAKSTSTELTPQKRLQEGGLSHRSSALSSFDHAQKRKPVTFAEGMVQITVDNKEVKAPKALDSIFVTKKRLQLEFGS